MKTYLPIVLLFFAACAPLGRSANTGPDSIGYGSKDPHLVTGSMRTAHMGSSPTTLTQVLKRLGVSVPRPGAAPLVVVDGRPIMGSDMSWLHAHEIAKVTVLKDAASCAIYGARGGGGVVLITTKP